MGTVMLSEYQQTAGFPMSVQKTLSEPRRGRSQSPTSPRVLTVTPYHRKGNEAMIRSEDSREEDDVPPGIPIEVNIERHTTGDQQLMLNPHVACTREAGQERMGYQALIHEKNRERTQERSRHDLPPKNDPREGPRKCWSDSATNTRHTLNNSSLATNLRKEQSGGSSASNGASSPDFRVDTRGANTNLVDHAKVQKPVRWSSAQVRKSCGTCVHMVTDKG